MSTVLIIEDEAELVKILKIYLEKAGYTVFLSVRGDEGLTLWEQSKPDLLIIDLNLPGVDGLEVTRTIRKKSDVPIIMLTARVEEMDRLIGLELGADDYISKPFSPREVVARVKAVLRRSSRSASEDNKRLEFDDLVIDIEGHRVTRGEQILELTPTEFSILVTLASQPGRVFSRLQLLEQSQGTAYEGYERTIDAHVKNLRSKVESDPHNPQCIETVFGVGYRFRRN
jgi:DNA-binding response OmpR family regulator